MCVAFEFPSRGGVRWGEGKALGETPGNTSEGVVLRVGRINKTQDQESFNLCYSLPSFILFPLKYVHKIHIY